MISEPPVKAFIIWTGLVSGISGVALQFPPLSARLFPEAPPDMVLRVFGLVAIFLGLLLFLCSRDLRTRGVLVMWEGVLRVIGGLVIAGYGFFGGHGILTGLAGLGDFAIGGVYLICLPRHLNASTFDLLLDRHKSTGGPH